MLELKFAAAEPPGVFLDLHSKACICAGTHVTDFLILIHDPVTVLHHPQSP